MWQYVAASVAGKSHLANEIDCQDVVKVEAIHDNSRDLLVVICSDGAGSAAHAQRGAKTATDHGMRIVINYLAQNEFGNLCRSQIESWYSMIHGALNDEAGNLGVGISELHCTLMIAILGQDRSVFAQLGDGAMVFGSGGILELAFWPQTGEFANTTYFVTGENFRQHLGIRIIDKCVSRFAAFTDGMERLVLNFGEKAAHEPFFRQMFQTIQSCDDTASLNRELIAFLNSQHFNDRTDDDRTLVIAVRREDPAHPPQSVTADALASSI